MNRHLRAYVHAPGGMGEGTGKIERWGLGCEQGATELKDGPGLDLSYDQAEEFRT